MNKHKQKKVNKINVDWFKLQKNTKRLMSTCLKWVKGHKLVSVFVLGISVLLIFGVISLVSKPGQSLANITQSSWSGGQGTDPSSQYDSISNAAFTNDGKITLGPDGYTNWCNTTNCNSSSFIRKPIHIKNTNPAITRDATLRVRIAYDSGMNNDFSNLRFTNAAGNQDLTYYILNKSDHDWANVLILLPANSVPNGNSDIYVYFGDTSLSSLSDEKEVVGSQGYSASDDGNGTLSSRWRASYYATPITLSGGKVKYDLSTQSWNYFNYDNSMSADNPSVMELSISRESAAADCNDDYTWRDYFGINDYSYVQTRHACDNDGGYWWVAGVKLAGQDYYPNLEDSIKIRDNQEIWLRFTSKADHTAQISYSTNNGDTYTAFPATSGNQFSDIAPRGRIVEPSVSFGDLVVYQTPDVQSNVGIAEFNGGRTTTLNSVPYYLGNKYTLGALTYNSENNGIADVRVRTGDDVNMTNAKDFEQCPVLPSGVQSVIDNNSCFDSNQHYLQYQVILSAIPGQSIADTMQFLDINIEHSVDDDPPATNASNIVITQYPDNSGGTNSWRQQSVVQSGSWVWSHNTNFTWTAATDNQGGSGIKGYCIYIGSDPNADPTTSSGIISINDAPGDPVDTQGTCPYAISNTEIESLDAFLGSSNVYTGQEFNIAIKAIDNVNNVYPGDATRVSVKFDNEGPRPETAFAGPQGAINSKIFTVTWNTDFGSLVDNYSGAAGIKYCITNILEGFMGCGNDGNVFNTWYGLNHGSGSPYDYTDVIPFSNGSFTTVSADAGRIDGDGANIISIIGVDYAGNFRSTEGQPVLVTISSAKPSSPANLQVNPTSSTQNNFSFTWSPPSTLGNGVAGDVNYCWTINAPISSDASNCNWTGKGITQLAAGAYATQQGTNTFRLMARNQAGNYDTSAVASVVFSASTASPGPPQHLDIADVSTKATSTWKLALSWDAPSQVGSGVAKYKIFRSTDNTNFTQVGSTSGSNTSYIDSGLTQVDYYYQVKACDNANSCSVASNIVTKKPTGRFTIPARLTSDTDQPKVKEIGTKKNTIYWFTDRDSDSRIAYGTSPGNYFPAEVGNSTQTVNHVVNLTNLQPGTRYYYIAKWTDSDGNTGQSTERSFTTTPAPEISEVSPQNISVSGASINFTSQYASKVKIYYGRSEGFGDISELNTAFGRSNYKIQLGNLQDGSRYYFKMNTFDSDGNEYQGNIYSFTTLPRPKITNLRFQPVEGEPSSTQKITWDTNVASNSELSYGVKDGARIEVSQTESVLNHEVVISNLNDASTYTLVARSRDTAGNLAASDLQTFQTALDTRPPKITDLRIETVTRSSGGEGRGQIIVSWKTDEPSTSQVAYGPGQTGAFTNKTSEDTRLTKEHVVVVSDVPTSSVNHLKAVSRDKAANEGGSETRSVIVGRGSESVFTIILRSLQQIFGFK